jgi:hydrogenase maturation protein HypF
VRRRYREVVADLGRLFQVEPRAVVCDKHPDYFSTRLAQESGLPMIAVQHHVAHAAATLAEHGEVGPALAITWDGTGLGDDGGIWGGEFFRVEPGRAERVAALWPFPLVGGDRAAKEPRRSAAGVLFAADAWNSPEAQSHIAGWFSPRERRMLDAALRSPHTAMTCTSAGRLFDAWAALLGLSDRAAFEAEPAMRLEDAVDPHEDGALTVVTRADPDRLAADDPSRPCWRIDWRPWVDETRRALEQGTDRRVLAARFHNGLAQACLEIAGRVGLETVVLGGGCFQNARLSHRVETLLAGMGFRVLTPRRVPAGDGGLAVGQLWAAALGLTGAKLGTLR